MSFGAAVVSIINHKGGTAKTTSAVHLAAALAKKGKRVLAIDLDTQANLTHWLIGDIPEDELTIAEAILDETVLMHKIIKPSSTKNLDVAPAGESMVNLELTLASIKGSRENLLQKALEKIKTSYDFIIVDNPPNIGLTTINSLVASDYFLVPVPCEYLPMVGVKHLLRTIAQVQSINESLHNLGYLLTMVDRREGITSDVEKILRDSFKNEVFKTVIRIDTKLKICPQKKTTIFEIESPKGRAHEDYMNVAKEILKRMEAKNGTR